MSSHSASADVAALSTVVGERPAEAEWLEWRRGGIGASDVAALVGLSPYSTNWSVWLDKLGIAEPTGPAPHLQLGRDLEPVIGAWFHRETGLYVAGEQTWCEHAEHGWARCTVDGFVVESAETGLADALGVFEAKYTSSAPWDEPPDYYVAQVQWQMYVTGHDRAWIAAMHLPFGRPDFRIYEVDRDETDVELLVDAASTFWHDSVLGGTAPSISETERAPQVTAEALAAFYAEHEPNRIAALDDVAALVAERAEIKARQKTDADRLVFVENVLRSTLGSAEIGTIDGEPVLSCRTIHRKAYTVTYDATTYRALRTTTKRRAA